jgi:ADP-heptose:LPS heptosyltransferase
VEVVLGPVEAERGPAGRDFPPPLAVRWAATLEELREALAGAVLVVGNDSGPTHLAAAAGRPVVVLFGPTDPAVWAPPWEGALAVQAAGDLGDLEVGEVLEVCRLALG